MAVVRILLGGLIVLAGLVLILPALVLVDLVSGGTGLGLCPEGLGVCTTSMYTSAELLAILTLSLGAIGAGIALCLRILRWSSNGRPNRSAQMPK